MDQGHEESEWTRKKVITFVNTDGNNNEPRFEHVKSKGIS
jgi:hypothetical protein